MRFYVEEITVLRDGTSAHVINEKESKDKALSDFHLAMAYAFLNDNISTFHCEAKDSLGELFRSDTIVRTEAEETAE